MAFLPLQPPQYLLEAPQRTLQILCNLLRDTRRLRWLSKLLYPSWRGGTTKQSAMSLNAFSITNPVRIKDRSRQSKGWYEHLLFPTTFFKQFSSAPLTTARAVSLFLSRSCPKNTCI